MDLAALMPASAAPAAVLTAAKAQDVYKTTAQQLLAAIPAPARTDSAQISPEARALLAAEEAPRSGG